MLRTYLNDKAARDLFLSVNEIVKRLSRGAQDGDDIVQEVMIKILARQVIPEDIGTAWLYAVARNTMIDRRRAEARERKFVDRRHVVNETGNVKHLCDQITESEQAFEQDEAEMYAEVRRMLCRLSDPLRSVLVLYAQGCSYEQIGVMTRTKIGTVRSRLHCARKRAKFLLRAAS